MLTERSVDVGGDRVEIRFGDRLDGDLGIDAEPQGLVVRRSAIVDRPWTWLRQVHGAEVIEVDRVGGGAGAEADAAVTGVPGAVLAVHTADCVPVLLVGEHDGRAVIGAAHGGWRGLYDGVVEATVAAMEAMGARVDRAFVGPTISAAAYEFAPAELTTMALRFGPEVVAATGAGRPAFDTRAATTAALRAAGVDEIDIEPACTANETIEGSPRFFSWRARADSGRQASVIWIERP